MDSNKARGIIFDRVKTLPTLPEVVQQLLLLMQDDSSSAQELADVIAHDASISIRLLKVANSAYYGFMGKIATVRHAITVLGLRQVKSLALGISVMGSIRDMAVDSVIDQRQLWLHSVGCAMASQLVGAAVEEVNLEIVFTASLLHDIGKIVLCGVFPRDYTQVIAQSGRGMGMFAAEAETFGFHHGDVGGWLCEWWKLPPELTIPVAQHHHIEQVEAGLQRLAAAVQYADCLCRKAAIGYRFGDQEVTLSGSAAAVLGLSTGHEETLLEAMRDRSDMAQSFLSAVE